MLITIDDYKNALLFEDPFKTIRHLKPVKDEQGEFLFNLGKFSVVFKMQDFKSGRFYALKCFCFIDLDKLEYIKEVSTKLSKIESPYLIEYHYKESEIWVDNGIDSPNYLSVILMPWVEGDSLNKYIEEIILNPEFDHQKLVELIVSFGRLMKWLLTRPFAHGDINPENIIINKDGHPVLVDYDGFFFHGFESIKAFESGTQGFQNPNRNEKFFNRDIDDVGLINIYIGIHAISTEPEIWFRYCDGGNFILSDLDLSIQLKSRCWNVLISLNNPFINASLRILHNALYFNEVRYKIIDVSEKENEILNYYEKIRAEKFSLPKLIPFREQNKWGYIDQFGEIKIPLQYEKASRFSEGLAAVKIKNSLSIRIMKNEETEDVREWGYINELGEKIIPFKYDKAFDFEMGVAKVSINDYYYYIDKFGKKIHKEERKRPKLTINNEWFARITLEGKLSFEYCADHEVELFNQGLFPVMNEKNKKFGYLDKKFKIIVPFIYDFASPFKEGLAQVILDGNCGFINRLGKVVVDCKYEYATDFKNGLSMVKTHFQEGFIDKKGFQYWK